MGRVCPECGGKGWRWTGHNRVSCRTCGGRGYPLPPDERLTTTHEVRDPIKHGG
jgi:DnaJ-class molecular chaperone